MEPRARPLVVKIWEEPDCVVFHKVAEEFGGLSNMAGGFPLVVDGVEVRTSEALYQAMKFPLLPGVQREILAERSPMAAKMRAKPHAARVREDWELVRVDVMRWCLRVKLAQHPRRFGALLRETGERAIVERSRRDRFWGAVPVEPGVYVGINQLGLLLVELREAMRLGGEVVRVEPPAIGEARLLGREIGAVCAG